MSRGWLVFLAACGGAVAPTSTPNASTSANVVEMKAVSPTAYADDLRAVGVDPANLPQLNKLAPEQLRKVMPLMAKSLGVKCDACHDMNADMATKTPRMKVAEHMWNDFVRVRTIGVDRPVFCDSCHHGSRVVLDRRDRPALEKWMQTNFVESLGPKIGEASCKSCHGEPPRWRFLDAWRR